MFYLGIDPGKEGAIAVMFEDELWDVIDCPLVKIGGKNKIDPHAILRTVGKIKSKADAVFCAVELVGAMPSQKGMFDFGRGFGYWEMALIAHEIPHEFYTPTKWKPKMMPGLPTDDKGASMIAASRQFPAKSHLFVGPQGGTKDGRAEAALIAEYGRRCRNAA